MELHGVVELEECSRAGTASMEHRGAAEAEERHGAGLAAVKEPHGGGAVSVECCRAAEAGQRL